MHASVKREKVKPDIPKGKTVGQRPFVEGISQSLDALLNAGYEIFEEIWSKSENKGCYRP